jgi:hypothetical protein
VNAERLNSGCGLSRDPALARFPGGGGNMLVDGGLGEGLCSTAGDVRCAGEDSSGEMVFMRWLRGGEYGGGAGTK